MPLRMYNLTDPPASNFDCDYAFTLGGAAATLVQKRKNGYLATVTGLKLPVPEWKVMMRILIRGVLLRS